MTSTPDPSTAIVRPFAASAPRWAAESTPRAMPLTTTMPAAAMSDARRPATDKPYDEAARAPTMATADAFSASIDPRTQSTGGGSTIVRSANGYDAASQQMGASAEHR